MSQQVEAYGQIIEFPDEMSPAEMEKVLQSQDHIINPNASLYDKTKGTISGLIPSDAKSVSDLAVNAVPQEPTSRQLISERGLFGRAKDIEVDRLYANQIARRDAVPGQQIDKGDYNALAKVNTKRRAQDEAAGSRMISERLAGVDDLSPEERAAHELAIYNESSSAAEIKAKQKAAIADDALRVLAKSDTPEGVNARSTMNNDAIERHRILSKGDTYRGARSAFLQMPQLAYGVEAATGAVAEKIFGKRGLPSAIKQAGINGYKEWGDKVLLGSKDTDSASFSYNKAKQGDYGALVDWLQYAIGYTGGQVATIIASGIGGGAAMKTAAGVAATETIAKGMIAKESARILERQAGRKLTASEIETATHAAGVDLVKAATSNVAENLGQTAIIGAQAFGMEGGEIFGDMVSKAQQEGRDLSGTDLARGLYATGIAGLLEFAGDKLGFDVLLGKSPIVNGIINKVGSAAPVARGAAAGVVTGLAETGVEAGQTVAEEFGKGNNPFTDEGIKNILDSSALGFAGGSVVGGVGGVIHKPEATLTGLKIDPKDAPNTKSEVPDEAIPSDQVFGTPESDLAVTDDALGDAISDTESANHKQNVEANAAQAKTSLDAQKSTESPLTNSAIEVAKQQVDQAAVSEASAGEVEIRAKQVAGWSDDRINAFISSAQTNVNLTPSQEMMLGLALGEVQRRQSKQGISPDMSILSQSQPTQEAPQLAQAAGTSSTTIPAEQLAPPTQNAGHSTEIVLPDNTTLPAQWEVVDADQVSATLKEGQNQPRDRSRAASSVQVQGIANNLNYSLLRDSPVMDFGAPTLSKDGAIVGGNGRFEGISQAYEQGSAADYRAKLDADAAEKGIDPATFSGMKKPVLVRRITKPFDTRALAVASNSGGSLQYSALEQAKIDGERMSGLGDIEVTDTGDVVMSGDNMKNVRRALGGYTAAELGSLTDKDGMLSQEGIRRIKNALLYKAYGNSSVLSRLVESADPDLKSVMGALVRAAGAVASVRSDMQDGNKPAGSDIVADLLSAIEQLAKIKAQGISIEQHLAQNGLFGKDFTDESAEILRFLNDNIRSQKRMAEFLRSYYDGLAQEDHLTSNMFDTAPITNKERLNHAIQTTNKAESERPSSEVRPQAGQQPEGAQGNAERSAQGQQNTSVEANAEPVAVEPSILETYTNADILKREAAAKKAEEEANKETPAKNVTADQADLFNTQDSLFNSSREQPVVKQSLTAQPESSTAQPGNTEQSKSNKPKAVPGIPENTISVSDIPKSLKITLEKVIDGKTKRKQVNAQKAVLAANQRVAKLEALRKCLS